jgi:hypothetical protein
MTYTGGMGISLCRRALKGDTGSRSPRLRTGATKRCACFGGWHITKGSEPHGYHE